MSLIYGVGIREEGEFLATVDGKHSMLYTAWKNMLARCYSEVMHSHRTTYVGCKVEGDFIYFQKFARWYTEQTINKDMDYQLEKDLFIKGNKVYSEKTCFLVPRRINMFLCKSEKKRGEYPIGVCWHEKMGRFVSQLSVCGVRAPSKFFDTPEEAFDCYKERKEAAAKQLAKLYVADCSPDVIALLNAYTVDIND